MLIYQIGDQIIRGYSSVSSDVSFEDTGYISGSNNLLYYKSTLPKLNVVNLNISGNLYIYDNTTPNKQINNLLSLAGRPYVDIIGYMPAEYKFAYNEINFVNSDTVNARWFHTYGQIVSVSRQISDESDFNTEMPLNISVSINPIWSPLNEWIWFSRYELSRIYTTEELSLMPFEKSTLPNEVVDFNYSPHFRFYRRGGIDETAIELYTNSENMWENWLDDKTSYKYYSQTISSNNSLVFNTTTDDNYAQYIIYKFSGDNWGGVYPNINIRVASDIVPMRKKFFDTSFKLEINNDEHLIIPSDIQHFIVDNSNNIIKNTDNDENKMLEMFYTSPMPAVLLGKFNSVNITSDVPVDCEILIYNRVI